MFCLSKVLKEEVFTNTHAFDEASDDEMCTMQIMGSGCSLSQERILNTGNSTSTLEYDNSNDQAGTDNTGEQPRNEIFLDNEDDNMFDLRDEQINDVKSRNESIFVVDEGICVSVHESVGEEPEDYTDMGEEQEDFNYMGEEQEEINDMDFVEEGANLNELEQVPAARLTDSAPRTEYTTILHIGRGDSVVVRRVTMAELNACLHHNVPLDRLGVTYKTTFAESFPEEECQDQMMDSMMDSMMRLSDDPTQDVEWRNSLIWDEGGENDVFGSVDLQMSNLASVTKGVDDKFVGDCSICMEDFVVGSVVGVAPCNHYFHNTCITRWLHVKHLCPLCRSKTVC